MFFFTGASDWRTLNYFIMDSEQLLNTYTSLVQPALTSWAAAADSRKGRNWAAQQAEIQQKFALEQLEKQNEFNVNMVNAQNAYNAPSAQRKRLEEAGLNLNLGEGLSSSNQSSPVTSVGLPEYPNVAALESAASQRTLANAQVLMMQQDAALKAAQTKALEKQSELTNEKAISERDNRLLVQNMMKSQISVNDTQCKLNIQNSHLSSAQYDEVYSRIDKLSQETDNLAKMYDILEQDLLLKKKEVNWYDENVRAQLSTLASQRGLNAAQSKSAVAMAQLLGEQYNTQKEITAGKVLENGISAINFNIADKTSSSNIKIGIAKGQKAQIYLDTPKWTKNVNGFVEQVSPAVGIFMDYIKMGQSGASAAAAAQGF